MRLLYKTFIIIALMLSSYNGMDAQTKRNNVRSTQKQSPKQFYVTLKLQAGYANHLPIKVYSKLGVDLKVACTLSSQNVYKAEGDFSTSTMATPQVWCKLFSLEGKYIGYVSSKNLIKCNAPVAPKLEMVHVKGATFMMGDNTDPEASPEHPVSVSDFEMCKYEISPEQWNSIFGGKGIQSYSWDDVQNFIRILNHLTKKHYRLPTEAEWEYAAKGGRLGNGYKYSGSDNASDVAWHKKNSDFLNGAKMVVSGNKKPNELGIYDMSGNLWEFCQDRYDYYHEEAQTDPVSKSSKSGDIVIRGGAVDTDPERCSTTYRGRTAPNWVNKYYGFRLVLSTPQQNKNAK
jgi:formylglycine-generating enzyme required for sulfatase activity